jgi:hypothetical protein
MAAALFDIVSSAPPTPSHADVSDPTRGYPCSNCKRSSGSSAILCTGGQGPDRSEPCAVIISFSDAQLLHLGITPQAPQPTHALPTMPATMSTLHLGLGAAANEAAAAPPPTADDGFEPVIPGVDIVSAAELNAARAAIAPDAH